jgi:hypothetical protein
LAWVVISAQERRGHVLLVRLDRPQQRNALNLALRRTPRTWSSGRRGVRERPIRSHRQAGIFNMD